MQERRDSDGPVRALTWRSDVLARLIGQADYAEPLPTEFNEVEHRRADMIARLTSGAVMHLEFQSDLPATLGWRMVNYRRLIRAHLDGSAVLHQAVLYVGEAPTARTRVTVDDGPLQYGVPLVDMGALDPDIFLAAERFDDAVLAVLTRSGGRSVRVVRALAERIAPLTGTARADAVSKLASLAGLRNLSDWIYERLPMPIAVDYEKNAFFREAYRAGQAEGMRAMLRHALDRRGLTRSPELEAAIDAADSDALMKASDLEETVETADALIPILTSAH